MQKQNKQTKNESLTSLKIWLITSFVAKDGEALHSQQKQDRELTVAQIMNSPCYQIQT